MVARFANRTLPRSRWFVVVLVITLAGVTGCTVNEVTRTQNGQTLTDVGDPPRSGDVDPCGLDDSFLRSLSVDPADLSRGSGEAPTCSWEKNAFTEPRLYYWVEGETAADESNATAIIGDNREVEVFYDSEVLARYILRTDDLTFNVSYSVAAPEPGETLDPSAPEGVAEVIEELLRLYGE